MPLQKKMPGTARKKRNSWSRGNGSYSMRGELKRGISLNKKTLNRKVRHNSRMGIKGNGYKKVCRTINMIDFT